MRSPATVFGLILTVLHLAACTAAGLAPSADAQSRRARNLAATCAGCHGTAEPASGGMMAPLAGRERDELLRSFADFRAGRRPATIMDQILRGYSDAQLAQIAAWYAAQRATPGTGSVPAAQASQ